MNSPGNVIVKAELSFSLCQCCDEHFSLPKLTNMLAILEEEIFLGPQFDPLQSHNTKTSCADLLNYCFALEITASNGNNCLYICEMCKDKLTTAYQFKEQVKKTQNSLKGRNSQLKQESLNEIYQRGWIEVDTVLKQDKIKENETKTEENEIDEREMADEIFKSEIPDSPEVDDLIDHSYDELDECDDRKKQRTTKKVRKAKKSNIAKIKNNSIIKKTISKTKIKKEKINLKSAINILENNILSTSGPKIQNSLENLSKDELKQYKRVYRKHWYSKLVPFKLEKTDLVCKVCNETFLYNRQLVVHMKIHFPNHICDLCGLGFVTLKNLSSHRHNTHDTDMAQCDICKKELKKRNMKKHLGIHNGNRFKYKCSLCQEVFLNYYKLRKHMTMIHNVAPRIHYCKYCPKTFASSGGLYLHAKKFHK